MKCYLCSQELQVDLTFTSLLLLKRDEPSTCPTCFASFEKIREHHCQTCFKEGEEAFCQDCHFWYKEGIQVDHEAIFTYNDAMKDYFSRYKFDGDYLLRKVFPKILRQALQKYSDYQIVIIPLSQERLKSRGFNQVEGLIKETGLPYQDILIKKEVDASSNKNRSERLLTEFPFVVRDGAIIPKCILLVDDIYTTGTTVNRTKRLLLESGCQKIKTFSLVR